MDQYFQVTSQLNTESNNLPKVRTGFMGMHPLWLHSVLLLVGLTVGVISAAVNQDFEKRVLYFPFSLCLSSYEAGFAHHLVSRNQKVDPTLLLHAVP